MSFSDASSNNALATLASRDLPRRVHELLSGLLLLVSEEIEAVAAASLDDFEQRLFEAAEKTRSHVAQTRWLQVQRQVKDNRAGIAPRLLAALEAELAVVRDKATQDKAAGEVQADVREKADLSLLEEPEMDEDRELIAFASRDEAGHSLSLYLLGQRFGVLAEQPALSVQALPIGPRACWRAVRYAVESLTLVEEHRMMYYRLFDERLASIYGNLVEAANAYLVRNHVLPNLQYVPLRLRPVSRGNVRGPAGAKGADKRDSQGETRAESPASAAGGVQSSAESQAPPTGGISGNIYGRRASDAALAARALPGAGAALSGSAIPAAYAEPEAIASSEREFQEMRQLLAGRRQLLAKLNPGKSHGERQAVHVVDSSELQQAIGSLQARPGSAPAGPAPAGHLRQAMLAVLRESLPSHEAPTFSEEDGDAIDLVGLLFDSLIKETRGNETAAGLLARLRLPLLRVALRDKTFFTSSDHPARQLLGAIAETGANWLSGDVADAELVEKVEAVIERAASGAAEGDPGVFGRLLEELNAHLQLLARKAEVAEKRHVEAARGKEKLVLARERAAAAMEASLAGRSVPPFVHAVLNQAWTDVMALAALRHGEDSPAWKARLNVAERIIRIASAPAGTPDASPKEGAAVKKDIEQALSQVGYHGEEAVAVADNLVNPRAVSEEEAARTERAAQLKAKARLGVDFQAKKAERPALNADEQARLKQLKQTAFGTWFDFVDEATGERVRRRLSWFSTVSGHVMFVNHRGQKDGEHTLEGLAQMMVKGQLLIAKDEKASILDRAWAGVLSVLRSLAATPSSLSPA